MKIALPLRRLSFHQLAASPIHSVPVDIQQLVFQVHTFHPEGLWYPDCQQFLPQNAAGHKLHAMRKFKNEYSCYIVYKIPKIYTAYLAFIMFAHILLCSFHLHTADSYLMIGNDKPCYILQMPTNKIQ